MKAHRITNQVPPLDLSRNSPAEHAFSISAQRALSRDIDLMKSVLGIVQQAHGIDYLYAHSVRVEQMSLSTLGNKNYQLFNDVLDSIQRETPNRLVRSSNKVYVPIYRIYMANHTMSFSWSVSAMGGHGEVFPEAVRFRRSRAVEETLRRLREHLEDKANTTGSFRQLLQMQTPVFVFDRPPMSRDAWAVMVETVWRTLKQKFPNEVTLAELAV